jgi:outer membrane lipoprotein carrier protein
MCVTTHAQSASKIVNNIQDKYDKIDNLTAEFLQTEYFKLTGSKNETEGKIFIKEGVKYRLETEDQTIVTDGKIVWTYSLFNQQVLIDRVKEGDGAFLPRDLLYKYPRDYFASMFAREKIDGAEHFVLKLDPKEEVHGFIKTMKIWVHSKTYLIAKVEYTDFNDNTSEFEIKKIDIKTKLSDILFNYVPTEGVEVVDLRM